MAKAETNTQEQKISHPARLPLLLASFLLLLSLAHCFFIWHKYSLLKEEAEANAIQSRQLEEKINWLQTLLASSPCDARARYEREKTQFLP